MRCILVWGSPGNEVHLGTGVTGNEVHLGMGGHQGMRCILVRGSPGNEVHHRVNVPRHDGPRTQVVDRLSIFSFDTSTTQTLAMCLLTDFDYLP